MSAFASVAAVAAELANEALMEHSAERDKHDAAWLRGIALRSVRNAQEEAEERAAYAKLSRVAAVAVECVEVHGTLTGEAARWAPPAAMVGLERGNCRLDELRARLCEQFGINEGHLERSNEKTEVLWEDKERMRRGVRRSWTEEGVASEVFEISPLCDTRLGEGSPYYATEVLIDTQEALNAMLKRLPRTAGERVQELAGLCAARVASGDEAAAEEGARGLWELAAAKVHHAHLKPEVLKALVTALSLSPGCKLCATAAIWLLAVSAKPRHGLVRSGVVQALVKVMKEVFGYEGEQMDPVIRSVLSVRAVGALAVLVIDAGARRLLFHVDPMLQCLVAACTHVEEVANVTAGEEDEALPLMARAQRVRSERPLAQMSAEALASTLIRDDEGRIILLEAHGLSQLLTLLRSKREEDLVVTPMVHALTSYGLDRKCLQLMAETGACDEAAEEMMGMLAMHFCKLIAKNEQGEEPSSSDQDVCESVATSLWGTLYSASMDEAMHPMRAHLVLLLHLLLSKSLGLRGAERAVYYLTGSLAALCRNERCAGVLCAPESEQLQATETYLEEWGCKFPGGCTLPGVFDTISILLAVPAGAPPDAHAFGGAMVRMVAAAGVAFLAAHDMEAVGDASLDGPFRGPILAHEAGIYDLLLASSRAGCSGNPEVEAKNRSVCICALMLLSTRAAEYPPSRGSLEMVLDELETDTGSLEALQCGVPLLWLLLRDADARDAIVAMPLRVERVQVQRPPSESQGKLPSLVPPAGDASEEADEGPGRADTPEPVFETVVTPGRCFALLEQLGHRWIDEVAAVQPQRLRVLPKGKSARYLGRCKDDSDRPHVVRVMEFWVGALWLLLYGEGDEPTEPEAVYEQRDTCWWTLAPSGYPRLQPPERPELTRKLAGLLVRLVSLRGSVHQRLCELAAGLAWNMCLRDLGLAQDLVGRGVCGALAAAIQDEQCTNTLRRVALGFLQTVAENEHMVAGADPDEAWGHLDDSLVRLVSCRNAELAEFGTRALARRSAQCSLPPSGRPSPLVQRGALGALLGVMGREDAPGAVSYAAVAMQNLSVAPGLQARLAKGRGLQLLLDMARAEDTPEDVRAAIAAVLHNVALNPVNRTRLYKLELSTKASVVAEEAGPRPVTRSQSPAPRRNLKTPAAGERRRSPSPAQLSPQLSAHLRKAEKLETAMDSVPGRRSGDRGENKLPLLPRKSAIPSLPLDPETVAEAKAQERREKRAAKRDAKKRKGVKPVWERLATPSPVPPESPAPGGEPGDEEEGESNALPGVLVRDLRRPMTTLWANRDAAPRDPWSPEVAEYHTGGRGEAGVKLPEVAERLLSIPRPVTAATSLVEAANMLESAAASDHLELDGTLSRTARPENATPLGTRPSDVDLPLAVLRPQEASPPPGGRSGEAMIGLRVQLEPARPRNELSFELNFKQLSADKPPRAAVFEHVEGCKLCQGLYQHFRLPNGRLGHFYDRGSNTRDEVDVAGFTPPSRPMSLSDLLQLALPMADDVGDVVRPAQVQDVKDVYKPIPLLGMIPASHTLPVTHPDHLRPESFARLTSRTLKCELRTHLVLRQRKEEIEEDIVYKPPWSIEASVFRPRRFESDARDFYDNDDVVERMFTKDWTRVVKQGRFGNFVHREAKKIPTEPGEKHPDTPQVMRDMREILVKAYRFLFPAFSYYAALGSGSFFAMQLNEFTDWLDSCGIPDPESDKVKRSDCDTLFITADFVEDKKSKESKLNESNALMRFEWLELIVRLAVAKYGGVEPDPRIALQRILDECLVQMSPVATESPDIFRRERLYREEVDLLYTSKLELLKLVYKRHILRVEAKRPKHMNLEHWMGLMESCALINDQFNAREARMCFLRARMVVCDELIDQVRNISITFTDFLDALGRVADCMSPVTRAELHEMRYPNILEYHLACERGGDLNGPSGMPHPPQRASANFGTAKTRPLEEKLEMLMDLIFRRLDYDPHHKEEYSEAHLVKLLRAADRKLDGF